MRHLKFLTLLLLCLQSTTSFAAMDLYLGSLVNFYSFNWENQGQATAKKDGFPYTIVRPGGSANSGDFSRDKEATMQAIQRWRVKLDAAARQQIRWRETEEWYKSYRLNLPSKFYDRLEAINERFKLNLQQIFKDMWFPLTKAIDINMAMPNLPQKESLKRNDAPHRLFDHKFASENGTLAIGSSQHLKSEIEKIFDVLSQARIDRMELLNEKLLKNGICPRFDLTSRALKSSSKSVAQCYGLEENDEFFVNLLKMWHLAKLSMERQLPLILDF